jgi:geranylgeranyl diphosphate synthase type II
MVHCFSLIHDDLPAIDNDDLRRGVPTLHVKFGEAMAILAGDALFALAFQTLSSSPHPAERVVQATKLLTAASGSGGLVGGEVADVLSEGKAADAQTLEFIHSRKTGALIAAACEIGPTLAGAEDMQIDGCRTFGAKIGVAFQIADDILNETSSAEQLGKAAGSDRQREKATFPSLYGVDESQKMAESAVEEAIFALRTVGIESPGLEALARYAVERIH